MRPGRGLRVRAHAVRHYLLLGPRAERNNEQRQRGNGLSRGLCEGDWRRATPRRSFINGAVVPYSVAARAAPPIARRAAPPADVTAWRRPPPAPPLTRSLLTPCEKPPRFRARSTRGLTATGGSDSGRTDNEIARACPTMRFCLFLSTPVVGRLF